MLKTAARLTKSATSLLRGVDSVDRGAARERVAGLRKRYPKVERDELHKSMVYAKCLQAGAVGGVGAVLHSVPGLRLIADTLAGQLADDRVVATLQSELIAETFALYEIELSPPAERVAMATIAAGQAGASAVSGGIARHLAQQATLWLSGPLSRRALPLAKIATAVASHMAITYAIGTRARHRQGQARGRGRLAGPAARVHHDRRAQAGRLGWTRHARGHRPGRRRGAVVAAVAGFDAAGIPLAKVPGARGDGQGWRRAPDRDGQKAQGTRQICTKNGDARGQNARTAHYNSGMLPTAANFEQWIERARRRDPEACYQVGRVYAGHQEFSRARRYLRDAAELGHAEAMTELALFALYGIGVPPEIAEGVKQLRRAEDAGSGEAAYQLALIAWADQFMPFDLTAMAERLRQAALRDFAPALRATALLLAADARAGDTTRDAVADACLARATTLGDGLSAFLLARRRLAAGDRDQAVCLATLAARRGVPRARVLFPDLALDAPAEWPEAPRPELPTLRLSAGTPGAPQRLNADPLVEIFENIYDAEECEFIIALGEPHLNASMTLSDHAPVLSHSEYRSSSDHSFYTFQEDFGLRWLQWRMLALLDVPMHQAEHLSLLRYLPGEQYRPHRDYLPPNLVRKVHGLQEPGQRVHTVFCYLADVAEGGETEFPMYDLRISPRRGRVVHFLNVLPDGSPDPRTLHAGLPVKSGVKWLATLWTRQRRFRDY